MYISLASLFNHCTQGSTGDSSDTPPSLGRRSVIDNADASSVSTASSKLRDSGDEGVPILEVVHEVGELSALHAVTAGIKFVAGGGEGIQDAIEFGGELGLLLIKSTVSIHLGNSSRVVEALDLLNECVVTSIAGGKEGKEPGSCSLHGGLSIVRTEEEFDDIGGFPRLPPCQ